MADWPACQICTLPVELDEVARVTRTRIEEQIGQLIEGYRIPDDVHVGRCLRRYDSAAARRAIAASSVPDAPRSGQTN